MRSKSPLTLMEQVIMVLVFALAAVLCLQVFVFSDQSSRRNEAIDRAVIECQSAAETLKSAGGDMAHAQGTAADQMGGTVEQGLWYLFYNEDWVPVDGISEAAYALYAQGVPSEVEGLAQAKVWVTEEENGEELFSLSVSWQEVDGNG